MNNSKLGFTLIEVSLVITLMATLTMATVFTMSRSNTNNRQLENSSAQLSDAFALARSEAVSRNTGVQFRLIIDGAGDQANSRTYSLWSCPKNGENFIQLTKWEQLPANIKILEDDTWFVDIQTQNTDLEGKNPFEEANRQVISGVNYQGHEVTTLVVEFSPTGGIRQPDLGTGYSTILLADNQSKNGQVTNWRQIRISNLTGYATINTPQ
jgi:prepilin-type N-terminal cleavage/methylation domain-containing protein